MKNDVLDMTAAIEEKLPNEMILLLFLDSAMCTEIPFASSYQCPGFVQWKNVVLVGGCRIMFQICLLRLKKNYRMSGYFRYFSITLHALGSLFLVEKYYFGWQKKNDVLDLYVVIEEKLPNEKDAFVIS